MKDDPKKILSGLSKDVEQEKLLEYLNRHLSDKEQHEVEKMMADDPFTEDAVEGLQQMKNPELIPNVINQLNRDLRNKLRDKRKRRRGIEQSPWVYYAILFILLIAVVLYLVVKRM